MVPVYPTAGRFAPSLAHNARAASWLLWHSRESIWHFVFAPNHRTSTVGRWLKRWRGVPVVQTIASAPREFSDIEHLLFGDVVVAQSEWTRSRLRDAYDAAGVPEERRQRIEVIYPPLGPLRSRTPDEHCRVRAELGISQQAPLFVFPGDLETGGGVSRIDRALAAVLSGLPEAVVVLAYRAKSDKTRLVAAELERLFAGAPVRLAGRISDVLALVSGCTAVLFPVDDLWGKVDLPIVLLEAMDLKCPVVVLDHGPLRELGGAVCVGRDDSGSLAAAAIRLQRDLSYRAGVVERQIQAIGTRHRAPHVARAYEGIYLQLLGGTAP
jgi:phosphatidylinositol alpha-1,6-mannosyltransferase